MTNLPELVAVKPTVFFVRHGDSLRHQVEVQLAGLARDASAELRVLAPGIDERIPLGLRSEAGVVNAGIPDIREPTEVTFELWIDGSVASCRTVEWLPQRHWEVYLVQYAHHDLGYTDLPSNVLREYDGFYDQVLDFCAETEHWPEEDARFRYLVEQAWSVLHYVENRPADLVGSLMHYVRNGQIEIAALFGNQTLELCSHEEMVRLLYPAFDLARRFGFEISSAEHNDIPGFPWALASVLRAVGVKYFSPGVPMWYFGDAHPLWDTEAFLPLDRPAACWWEGPDGARVLLWSDLHGREFLPYNGDQAAHELPGMLAALQEGDYSFDMVSYTVRGSHRDNAPPTLAYAHIVRDWNARWAYPRLVNATNRSFLERFEERWGASLPVFRGDVPGTDYPVAASCTPRETALDRNTHDALRSAEILAAMASSVADHAYPRQTLDQAWRETFYYDLHCWGLHDVGGPAQDAHWSEKGDRAYRAAALAHDVRVKAANKLADGIRYPDDGYHLTVFNTLAQCRSEVITAQLRPWDPCGSPMFLAEPTDAHPWPSVVSGTGPGRNLVHPPADLLDHPFELIDIETGASVPYQVVTCDDPRAAEPWAPERFALGQVAGHEAALKSLVFIARDLPPIGYRTYRIKPCEVWPSFERGPKADADGLQNQLYQIHLDPMTGALLDVVDREDDRSFFDGTAPHLPGALIVRDAATGEEEIARVVGVAAVEAGPVFARVRVQAEASCCPRISQELTLYNGLNRIDVAFRILRDSAPMRELYVAFPFDVPAPAFRFEAPNAVIEPIRDQVPGSNTDTYAVQHWVSVTGEDSRRLVWSALDTPIAELGGLWPGYVSSAHHGVTGPGYGHPFLSEGELTKGHIYALVSYNNFRTNFINVRPDEYIVRYAFAGRLGDGGDAAAATFGWGVHTAPEVVWMRGPNSNGSLAPAASLVTLEGPDGREAENVVLLALKQAEDGDGLVLRLWETAGKAAEVVVRAPGLAIGHATICNLVEDHEQPLTWQAGGVVVPLRRYALATLRLRSVQAAA